MGNHTALQPRKTTVCPVTVCPVTCRDLSPHRVCVCYILTSTASWHSTQSVVSRRRHIVCWHSFAEDESTNTKAHLESVLSLFPKGPVSQISRVCVTAASYYVPVLALFLYSWNVYPLDVADHHVTHQCEIHAELHVCPTHKTHKDTSACVCVTNCTPQMKHTVTAGVMRGEQQWLFSLC